MEDQCLIRDQRLSVSDRIVLKERATDLACSHTLALPALQYTAGYQVTTDPALPIYKITFLTGLGT